MTYPGQINYIGNASLSSSPLNILMPCVSESCSLYLCQNKQIRFNYLSFFLLKGCKLRLLKRLLGNVWAQIFYYVLWRWNEVNRGEGALSVLPSDAWLLICLGHTAPNSRLKQVYITRRCLSTSYLLCPSFNLWNDCRYVEIKIFFFCYFVSYRSPMPVTRMWWLCEFFSESQTKEYAIMSTLFFLSGCWERLNLSQLQPKKILPLAKKFQIRIVWKF